MIIGYPAFKTHFGVKVWDLSRSSLALIFASTLLHVQVATAPALSILCVMDVAAADGEAAD